MLLPLKNFQWSGKIPDDIDLLHIWFQGELTCSSLVKMSSYPDAFSDFRNLVCFPSLVDVEFNFVWKGGYWWPEIRNI